MIFEEGSASGSGNMDSNPLLPSETSAAALIDFIGIPETSPGQVYAYRYSNTSVILGTRSAATDDVQTAIGLLPAADGLYHCVVENFVGEKNESQVRIQTVTSKQTCNTSKNESLTVE